MGALRSILVAVKDPTSRRLAAVDKAAQLAKATGAKLELFHAISTPLLADAYVTSPKRLVQAERTMRARRLGELERVAARVRRRGIEVAVSSDWDYPPYEAIIRRASRVKADLIVAERHVGRHAVAWLLHVTDWELIRLSPMPVLLVKSTRSYQRPTILASVDPGHAQARKTQLDREILRVGHLVSDALRGSLHAMHAFLPIPPLMMIAPPEPVNANIAEMLAADARAKASAAFGRLLASGGIPARRRHLVARPAIEAIPQMARQLRCDIVVMGAVSRSGLGRVFIGNTAERVLDELQCDVLVVKPARFVNRVGRARRGVRVAMSTPPFTF